MSRWQRLLEELRRSDRPALVLPAGATRGAPASVAILSGSFDPLTVGHVALARSALERVDLVVLAYSARLIGKDHPAPPPLLVEAVRLDLVRSFCRARERHALGLCSHGLLAEQAEAAAEAFPGSELWLVMGSDKVLQLLDPRWYPDRDRALDRVFSQAGVLYADRAGEEGAVQRALELEENRRWRERFVRLPIPPEVAAVSSSLVRRLILRGDDPGALVPEPVRAALLRAAAGAGAGPGSAERGDMLGQ